MTVRRVGKQTGLTLLELLLAMGIFSVIAGGLYGTFTRTALGRDIATTRGRIYVGARGAVDRIERDLAGSFATDDRDIDRPRFYGPLAEFGGLGAEEVVLLDFTTLSAQGVTTPELAGLDLPRPADRGDQARVLYRLAPTGELARLERRPPGDEPIDFEATPARIVARDVRSVVFRFHDGRQWLERWDSREPGRTRGRAPRAVETRIVVGPEDEDPVELVSAIALRFPASEAVK